MIRFRLPWGRYSAWGTIAQLSPMARDVKPITTASRHPVLPQSQ